MTSSEMSPADIAAVTGGNNGGWGGFGDGGWWIILLFLFAGWGGRGFGGNGGGGGGVGENYVLATDFATIERKLDGINNGICDSTFALNNTITNGFSNAELSRCNQQAALMAQLNAMAMNDAKCCCETQRLIERGFCDVNNTVQNNARDLLENQNNNTRAILDFLTQDKISTLQAENQGLRLAASQAAQNSYLINQLRPCPVPAYITCNPNAVSAGCGCGGSF